MLERMQSRTVKQWALVLVPTSMMVGFMLKSYQDSKIEQELYEEAMFQKIVEERKAKTATNN